MYTITSTRLVDELSVVTDPLFTSCRFGVKLEQDQYLNFFGILKGNRYDIVTLLDLWLPLALVVY